MLSVMLRRTSTQLSINHLKYCSSNILKNNFGTISCQIPRNISATNSTYNLLNKYQTSLKALTPVRNIYVTPTRMGAVDHSKLWTIERLLAVGLLATLPIAIAVPNPILDTVAAISIVMHQYWGFEAICHDYVRPIIFGPIIPKVTYALLVLVTLTTLGGLFYFNYNDVGISRAVRRFWQLGGQKPEQESAAKKK